MTDKKKPRKKTPVKRRPEEEDILIHLSLKCPSCGYEWSDSFFQGMSATPQCMKCFHKPVLLIEAVCF